MEKIFESIASYLNLGKTDYAIQINGEWGIGKTYFVLQELKPFIEKQVVFIGDEAETVEEEEDDDDDQTYKFIYISLNGLKNVDEIGERILLSYYSNSKLETGFAIAKSIIKIGSGVTSKFLPWFAPLGDAAEAVRQGIQNKGYKALKLNKLFLCFDDLERIDVSLKIGEVLGYINTNFVEHAKVKTLFISNQNKTNDSDTFTTISEKIIGRTLTFNRPITDAIEGFIEGIYEQEFNTYLKENIQFIKRLVQLANINNLRTFRFAMDNLSIVHGNLNSSFFEEDKWLLKNKEDILRSLLIFTLLISNEYKLGHIKNEGFLDILNIDKFTIAFMHLGKERKNQNELDQNEKYMYKFIDDYFGKNLELPILKDHYRFYKSVGSQIIHGALNAEELKKEIKVLIPFEEESDQALNSLKSYQYFEIEEIATIVEKVKSFIMEGNYPAIKLPSIYALILELHANQYVQIDLIDLKRNILKVVNKSFEKLGEYEIDDRKLNFEERIDDPGYKEIVCKVKAERKRLIEETIEYEVGEFLSSLGTDQQIPAYKAIQNQGHLFLQINKTNFAKEIVTASNKKILSFSSILDERYLSISNAYEFYHEEIPYITEFMDALNNNIHELHESNSRVIDKLKSNNLEYLLKKLNNVISHLKKQEIS